MSGLAFEGVIVGARADEEGSRSKERYFSPRNRRTVGMLEISHRNFGPIIKPILRLVLI